MEAIRTHKGRPVVRDWKQFAQAATGQLLPVKTDTPEYERAWNTYSGGASGGYLLDMELMQTVWDKARSLDGPLSRCEVFRTSKHELWLPGFNESSRVTGSRWGGIRAFFKGQKDNATMTQSQPAIDKISFQLQDVYVYSGPFSRDLFDDAPLVQDMMTYASHQEIRYAITDAMINGKGDASPLGIINAPASIQVTRNTGSAIKYQDIDTMWSRLWGPCKQNAVWHCTDSVVDELDVVFSGTSNWPETLYTPVGKANNAVPLIKGRPVIVVEQTSAIGVKGDLVLADWSQYGLCIRVPVAPSDAPTMEVAYGNPGMLVENTFSDQKYFDTDSVVFRYKARLDGKPMWNQAVTLADGSGQVNGPFVILN